MADAPPTPQVPELAGTHIIIIPAANTVIDVNDYSGSKDFYLEYESNDADGSLSEDPWTVSAYAYDTIVTNPDDVPPAGAVTLNYYGTDSNGNHDWGGYVTDDPVCGNVMDGLPKMTICVWQGRTSGGNPPSSWTKVWQSNAGHSVPV